MPCPLRSPPASRTMNNSSRVLISSQIGCFAANCTPCTSYKAQTGLRGPAVQGHRPRAVASQVVAGKPPKMAAVPEQLDFTTILACCRELATLWVPSKVESVVMADESAMALSLRAIDRHGWLHVSWHPIAARVCLGAFPERGEAAELFPIAKAVKDRCRAAPRCRIPWCRPGIHEMSLTLPLMQATRQGAAGGADACAV